MGYIKKTKKVKKSVASDNYGILKEKKVKKTKKVSGYSKWMKSMSFKKPIINLDDKKDKKYKHDKVSNTSLLKNPEKERNYFFALGVEKESHFFHIPKDGSGDNIIFDSQENVCFLTADMDKAGACSKLVKGYKYHIPSEKERKMLFGKKKPLNKAEFEWLKSLDWELTGRQAKGCKDGNVILQRVPVLMPEFITGNYKYRTINSIHREITGLENKYIEIQMRNPIVQKKVQKYGELRPHPCNFLDDIKIPVRPTIFSDDYIFDEVAPKRDYLGSYHITITLPHAVDTEIHDFVNLHKNMAMQFQWIEPLINGIYFSPDPNSMGSGGKRVKGSARIAVVGWGTLGGSDLRKLGKTSPNQKVDISSHGIGRATNIHPYWLYQTDFKDNKKLIQCSKTAPPLSRYAKYPSKAKSINTSDVRTFDVEPDMEKCKTISNPSDCPRVDAAPMKPPNGMELRIFDNFDTKYLLDLMRVLVLLGSNGDRHKPTKYVQQNPNWIKAVVNSMKDGWNSLLPMEYIKELREQLGVKLNINQNSRRLCDVFSCLVKELHQLNKNHMIYKMMVEDTDTEPKPVIINRMCWEMSFKKKFGKEVSKFIDDIYKKNKKLTLSQFKQDFFKNFSKCLWNDDVVDVLYALESMKKVKLDLQSGKIKFITIL